MSSCRWTHFEGFLRSRRVGGRHLFGQNVTLMTGDDAYFSKASPFKITILTEHLEKIGQKVTLLTNLDPPWSSYESINFLVLSHFWTFFFAKTGKCRFYTSISDFIEFSQNINFTLYYTIFLDFLKKIQGSYLRIFSKKAKKSSFELYLQNPIFEVFFHKNGKFTFLH